MKELSFDKFIGEIESDNLLAKTSLISNELVFINFLELNETIQGFVAQLRIDEANRNYIWERLVYLWRLDCDENHLHPYDHSIACYLYSFYASNQTSIEPCLKFVFENKLPNLYWTYVIYNYIVRNIGPLIETAFCESGQSPQQMEFPFIDINQAYDSATEIK